MVFVGGILTVVLVGRGVVPVSRGVHVITVVYAHRYVSGLAAFAASFVSRGVVLVGGGVIPVVAAHRFVFRLAAFAAFFVSRGVVLVSRGTTLVTRGVVLVSRGTTLVGRGAIPIAAFFIFRPDCRECVVAADFVGVARIIL